MRRFIIPFLLLFILMALTIKQATPRTAVALYNHPGLSDAMVEVRTVRTFLPMTAFEREVRARSVFGYHVASVSNKDRLADWVSPREDRVVLSKPEGRWHRSQTWRRMS